MSGGIPSYYDTASTPLTCRTIATDVARRLTYATPLTARRDASSRRVTTISVIGYPTLRVRPSPPRTCMTTPKSKQFAPCMEVRENPKGPLKRTRGVLRGISSSETYGRRGHTVFTTCVSQILTPPPTSLKPPRSACRTLIKRRSTSMPASLELHSLHLLIGRYYQG